MMVCVVLLVLLHCTASTVVSQTTPVSLYTKATTAENVLIVSPSPANCTRYHEPCHTLSEYAHNIDKYVSDNTKFVFLPGTHYLDTDFRVSNVSSLVILGDNSSLPAKLSSRVVCNSSAAKVAITGVSQLFISTLEVTSCGENVSVSIEGAEYFALASFHLLNSKTLSIYNSTALLEDTNFTNNTGTGCGGSVRIEYSNVTLNGTNSFAHGHTSESGGGMCVIGSTLTVVGNSTFTENVAQEGGGAIVMYGSALILISESSVVFSRNTAEKAYAAGGAVYIEYASIISLMPDSSMVFTGNTAGNNGGALCMAQSSSMMLKSAARMLFTNNSAGVPEGYAFGGAIRIESSTINMSNAMMEFTGNTVNHAKLESGGGAVSVQSSTFNLVSNSSMKFTANKGNTGGAIVATNLYINLMSNSTLVFAGNVADSPEGTWSGISGGAIHLLQSSISLMPGTSIEFTGNTAVSKDAKGGAVYLENSTINLMSSTSIMFTGNRANGTGGAIYVKDEFFSLYCLPESKYNLDECFFQVPEDYSDIHLVFDDNSAAVGSDIYGGMIDRCLLQHQNTTNSTTVFNNITENYSKLGISSPPYQLCHCENTNDCLNYIVDYTVYPGETINISVLTMGQRQGPSPAILTMFSDPNFPQVKSSLLPDKWPETSSLCSMLGYNVTSTDLKDAVYDLAVDICGTDSFKHMLLHVNIHFNNCQPFFELTSGTCKCARAIEPYTVDSVISNQSIAREGTTWIGYDNISHNYIAHLHCPSNYCNSERVYLNYSDIDKQCNTNHNRTGLLCGECKTNYSLMLGTSRCGKCSNYNLFLLLFFAFAGAALVVLLLVLRLTVAEGTINGLILFVNIFYVRRCQFLGTWNGCFPLNVFLTWLNLDFGIESCLYDGMDTYQNTWLQFLFPLYIWVLIGLVILSSRYSSWMTRKLGSNPVAVLATLVLLSYNKILQTIITVFSPTQLMYYNSTYMYENPTPTMHLKWLYDANISFLKGRHIPLFLIALLFLIFFLLPYTLLLVFGQCLQAKSNLKIFSWVNRPTFKYFLDNYHAPYQNSHRYWTGLMLLVRIVLLIAFACDVPNDPSQYMLAIITVVVCVQSWGWILGVSGVYKRQWVGILDASFVLNLIIVSAVTSYCYGQKSCGGDIQSVIGYTSLGVAFLTFIGILTYHLHMQVKGTALGRKLLKKCACGCCKKSEENEVLINND